MKRKLALAQFQAAYGENVYLPYAVGLLWAYARIFPEIREAWEEPIFLYKKESISKALARLGDPLPDLVAFSCYCWNWEFNRALARAIKEVSPSTIIVYGGVHVPDHPTPVFWEVHPEADILLHGEGEGAFASLLREYAGNRDLSSVTGISTRDLRTERVFPKIEDLRSPYLDGVFSSILTLEPRWQTLQETNRGCPF